MKKKVLISVLAVIVVLSAVSCGSESMKSERNSTLTQNVLESATESESVVSTYKEASEISNITNDTEISASRGLSEADKKNSAEENSDKAMISYENIVASQEESISAEKSVNPNRENNSGKSNTTTANQTRPSSSSNYENANDVSITGNTSDNSSEHTHTWVRYVANTIQHQEEGHYENKVIKEAYDELVYEEYDVCNKCGAKFKASGNEIGEHEVDYCMWSYKTVSIQVGSIHHDAETSQVWVVDKPSYTEYVYGQKCSGCGATK